MATLNESLATASKQLQAGRIDDAELIYRQIVSAHPNQVESIHNLGLIAFQKGDFEGATRIIQQAIKIKANDPALHSNLGNVFQARGKLDEAIHCYRQALKLNPAFVGALLNLGNVLLEVHRPDEAVTCFLNAIDLKPDSAEAHNFLGDALREQSKIDKSIRCYQKAIKLNPKYPQAFNNLGVMLQRENRSNEALQCFAKAVELNPGFVDALCNLANSFRVRGDFNQAIPILNRAIQLLPNFVEAHSNLGLALQDCGRNSEAIDCFRRALQLRPESPEVLNNLGNALCEIGDFDAAIDAYQKAISIRPDYVDAHCNLGIALKDVGRFDEALNSYEQALRLDPEHHKSKFGKSVVLLIRGEWSDAWPLYEHRWWTKDFQLPVFDQPRWDGSDIRGKTILLTAEQGLGDTIQFARYAKLVQELGCTVILQCRQSLTSLFQELPGVDRCILDSDPLPNFDVYCSLLSLPGIFKTTVDSIPDEVPYLQTQPALVNRWKKKLAPIEGFKVGICWQGNPEFRDDRERSLPLSLFEPISAVPGVQLISLQKGFGVEQLLDLEAFHVHDFGDEIDIEFGPFQDTAAIMKNLDLVISVDTATAHLAGALGVPVWNLLAPVPHWPFLLHRHDTQWYPSMRLVRRATDDRGRFLIDVANELRSHIAGS